MSDAERLTQSCRPTSITGLILETTVNNSQQLKCDMRWKVRKLSHQFRRQHFLTSLCSLVCIQHLCGLGCRAEAHAKILNEVDLAVPDRFYEGKLLSVVNLTHPSSIAAIIWLQKSELNMRARKDEWLNDNCINGFDSNGDADEPLKLNSTITPLPPKSLCCSNILIYSHIHLTDNSWTHCENEN